MNNKVIVEIYVPSIDMTFNVFLPINKRLSNIIKLVQKAIVDLSDNAYVINENAKIYNKNTSLPYDESLIIKETDIRNGTSLILY